MCIYAYSYLAIQKLFKENIQLYKDNYVIEEKRTEYRAKLTRYRTTPSSTLNRNPIPNPLPPLSRCSSGQGKINQLCKDNYRYVIEERVSDKTLTQH